MRAVMIYRLGSEPPVRFAAAELGKYLARITRQEILVKTCASYDPEMPGLWLGVFGAFEHLARKKNTAK